jgi:hypothetical protein
VPDEVRHTACEEEPPVVVRSSVAGAGERHAADKYDRRPAYEPTNGANGTMNHVASVPASSAAGAIVTMALST